MIVRNVDPGDSNGPAWRGLLIPPVSALLLLLLVLSCGGASLESKPLDRPIIVDGKVEDWHDSLTYFKDAGIAVGAFNDGQALFICVTSWNQQIVLQAMNQGLTVWFSPGGAEEKKIGIEYPLLQDRIGHDWPGGQESADPLFAEQETTRRVALRGPAADDRRIVAVPDVPGLEVTAATVNGAFVYELKVPLVKSDQRPFAVGTAAGETVDVTFETTSIRALPEPRRDERRGRGGGMGGRGGGGSHRGMGGGRGGGMGRGAARGGTNGTDTDSTLPRIPKPMKFALKIRLAAL
jgi:uncharacterized membrane protein YgcG